ncbi:hypothetical protein SLEP1_g33949 [Rubroshorea leprosula]|uniref:Uncharacterized protein n=1 Tax=Rubroshorea leprosula TaxID=152421 RepID=A0AAV5KI99_9ROSI|nr:hypothetical protein SLEP1_g33949 [Rubroshorea leprosula]
MNFCSSSSGSEFYSPLTLSDLDLSLLKEVRVKSESDIERELEFFEDPDYIPPLTSCSESYKTKEMSFEDTLSIGGSEEVRMLEYSDVNIEGESSRSEQTEGGVKRNEVVEVGAEEVPVNILEVGDKRDKCYDSGADIVSEAGSRKEKGWYYFTPRSSNKEKRNLFSAGPSSIKGWKENFFFVDDTEWDRGDAEMESLATWKAKKANQNKYSLNRDEEEEIEKLVRKKGDIVDIMFLTSSDAIEADELYGPSALSEAEMNMFLNAVGGVAIPKKPKKKSQTLGKAMARKGEENLEKGQMSSTEPRGAEEGELRSKKKRDEADQAQKRKRVEEEVKGDEVVEFVPRPAPVELDPGLRETKVPAPGKGKTFVPAPSLQNTIFGSKNFSVAKNFINAYIPEVDRREAKEEVLLHEGNTIVKHALETATWVNALAQEFLELMKDRNSLQKARDELLKKNSEMRRELDIVVPTMTSLQEERDTLKTILSFNEKKRRMCEEENDAQEEEIRRMRESEVELKKNVQLLVHNGMEEHIGNFINFSTFDNIVNLYQLPTAILAFTDCRKKVKAEYPKVDITKITFGEQEERVEEDGESLSADFRPQVKLRWDHDAEGRAVFPPNFDFEFVAMEEEEEEAEGTEVEKSQPSPPIEVHPVPSEKE